MKSANTMWQLMRSVLLSWVSVPLMGLMVVTLGSVELVLAAERDDHEDEEENGLVMTAEERSAQGVTTVVVAHRPGAQLIKAPGEVVVNAYASTKVTPRIPAQVTARHVRLGEAVRSASLLVTLSSVEMAGAQGELLIADREWQRVEKLGRDVVSDRRFTEAQIARQQAVGKVIAYGMTETRVQQLLKQGDASRATGAFDLLSPQDGTIIRDDFIVGELIEPGRVLFEISDESRPWVEAMLPPRMGLDAAVGTAARVSVDGQSWIDGEVIQIRHQLDETTRTQAVRIEVDNRQDRLHPGQFVEAEILVGQGAADVLAVPAQSVMLLKGSLVVFRLEGDEFHPEPVEIGESFGGWTEIIGGVSLGDEIVVEGAFVLKSLLLKSELGEGHGH